MRHKLYMYAFVLLMAFALCGGAIPVVNEVGHAHTATSIEAQMSVSFAAMPNGTGGERSDELCPLSVVCAHSFACVTALTCWQVATWKPVWFSTSVKRLTDRGFSPEPTPPIS